MFNKVVFIALLALIGISSVVRAQLKIETMEQQQRIVEFLNCSDLSQEEISLSDTIYVDVESPCNLKAPFIALVNNVFLGSQHVFNINGSEVILTGNKFFGTEQEYYIRGMNVFSYKNLYEGQLQAHRVLGIRIQMFEDVYDGNRQIHEILGLEIKLISNEFRGIQYAFLEQKLPVDNFLSDSRIDDELKNEVSSYKLKNYACLSIDNKWGLAHTNNLPNGTYERFIQNVMPRISFDPRYLLQ
nr:EP-like protein [Cotesia vestalis bracovirus]